MWPFMFYAFARAVIKLFHDVVFFLGTWRRHLLFAFIASGLHKLYMDHDIAGAFLLAMQG